MAELETLRRKVKKNYKYLVKDLNLATYIDGLIEEDYFEVEDRQLVMREPSDEAKNRKFLDLLFKKNPKALRVLIKEMHEDNRGDAVERIETTQVDNDEAMDTGNQWWVTSDGVPADTKLNDKVLLQVVKCFSVANIYEVGAALGLTRPEIDNCVLPYPISPGTQAHSILVKWRNKNSLSSNILHELLKCFKEISDLIDQNKLQETINTELKAK